MAVICRKLVLLLALAVMPLQGVAAAVSLLQCKAEGGERAAHVIQAHGGHDQGVAHDNPPVDDGGAKTHTGHFCCHQVSGLPLVVLSAALPELPGWALSPARLRELFFPEQPKRPPLA